MDVMTKTIRKAISPVNYKDLVEEEDVEDDKDSEKDDEN